MRFARPPAPIALLAAIAALLATGCGSDSDGGTETDRAGGGATTQPSSSAPAGTSARSCPSAGSAIAELRVTGVGCGTGRAIAAGWSRHADCASPADASRFACTIDDYRCLGTATERGVAVSCARPQRSIAFIATRN